MIVWVSAASTGRTCGDRCRVDLLACRLEGIILFSVYVLTGGIGANTLWATPPM